MNEPKNLDEHLEIILTDYWNKEISKPQAVMFIKNAFKKWKKP